LSNGCLCSCGDEVRDLRGKKRLRVSQGQHRQQRDAASPPRRGQQHSRHRQLSWHIRMLLDMSKAQGQRTWPRETYLDEQTPCSVDGPLASVSNRSPAPRTECLAAQASWCWRRPCRVQSTFDVDNTTPCSFGTLSAASLTFRRTAATFAEAGMLRHRGNCKPFWRVIQRLLRR
jgi:hypothetical protein